MFLTCMIRYLNDLLSLLPDQKLFERHQCGVLSINCLLIKEHLVLGLLSQLQNAPLERGARFKDRGIKDGERPKMKDQDFESE